MTSRSPRKHRTIHITADPELTLLYISQPGNQQIPRFFPERGGVRTVKQYQFETQRLLIRNYCRKDVDEFIRVAEQPEVYVTTCGIPHEYPRRMAKKWLSYVKNCINSGISYEFAVILKENGTYIGNVGLINLDRMHNHAEISYYTDRAYRCLGLTTEAASEMLRFGFSALGLHKISGLYMSRNPASGRVMESLV